MAPKPKPKSTFKQKIKQVSKKAAAGALILAATGAPSAIVGYKVYKSPGLRSFEINRSVDMAHGTNLTAIKNVGESLSELNKRAEKEYAIASLKNKGQIARKLYYYDEKKGKIVVTEMDFEKARKIQINQERNYDRLDKLIDKKVTELNDNAGVSEIFYWNGKEITKVNLDLLKLNKLNKLLYSDEKKELDSITKDLLSKLKNNDAYLTKVARKMRVINDKTRLDYLASLSLNDFVKEIGDNPRLISRLSKVVKSLETYNENPRDPRNSREEINFIKQETELFTRIPGVAVAGLTEIALLGLWFKIKAATRKSNANKK